MKKVLFIIGARKEGHTNEICKYFAKCLQNELECTVEFLFLRDYLDEFCTGCHNCILNDEKKCPHYLEVKKIENQIIRSDALVLASPGYMFSVTGRMKNFLDHVAYNCHRPKYFGKKAFILANCTRWQESSVMAPMETWLKASGFILSGKVYLDLMPFPLVSKELEKKRKLLKTSARDFAMRLGDISIRKLKLSEVMQFHTFRVISSLLPNIFIADHRYYAAYRGSKRRWYVPAKVSFLTHQAAKIISKRIKKVIDRMIHKDKIDTVKKNYINKL